MFRGRGERIKYITRGHKRMMNLEKMGKIWAGEEKENQTWY